MPCDTLGGVTEDEERPKKAVRRVVKKTVVRPTAPSSRGSSAPSSRGDRSPVAKAAVPTRRTTTAGSAAAGGTTSTVERAPKPGRVPEPVRVPRPVRDRGPSLRERAGTAARGAAGGVRSGASRVGRGLQSGGRRVLDARLPHWPGPVGAAVAGLVAALVGTLLGAAVLELFSWALGVRAGGIWGIPAFILVMVAVWWAGSLLLGGLGHPSARLVSFLGVVIGLIVLLIALPSAAETAWAFVIVPVLGAASFAASQALVHVAQTVPAEEG